MSRITSSIKSINGVPTLHVDDKALSGVAYMVYYTRYNHYADFSDIGCRLFSVPVFFGDQPFNENTHFPPFWTPVFASDTPDYSEFDKMMKVIVSACPGAYVFPRVNVALARKWELDNPDELNDCGSNAFPDVKRACFSSDAWAEEIKRLLTLFVKHVEESEYRDNIIGYQIAGGQTEEWMTFDTNGSQGLRSREKFEIYKNENNIEGTQDEYYEFLSGVIASRLDEFACHVKKITENRLVVGAFYGYTYENPGRGFGHHALHKLVESKNVDFICSPVSYNKIRALGRDHAYMLPVDSLKLYNKLYFSENDTRTHLSKAPCDLPAYNGPIWFGPDFEGTLNVLKMHFAKSLINSHAMWWFDMWGGWFDDEGYMKLLEKMFEVAHENLHKPKNGRAEVAVFVDEKSVFCVKDSMIYRRVCYDFREILGVCSAPLDLYLTEDYEKVAGNYKVIVSLVPEKTDLSEKLALFAKNKNIPVVEITDENSDMTSDELRNALKQAGVHLYSEKDAVIYANESYLFLHTACDGEQKIILPEGMKLREVFGRNVDITSFESKKGESYLFEIL